MARNLPLVGTMYRMAQEQGLLWRCEYESCGHRWIAASKEAPEKCGKCRRRGWHKTLTTAELVRQAGVGLDERIRQIAREVFEEAMAGLPMEEVQDVPHVVPQPAGKPDMDKLRAIYAGTIPETPTPSQGELRTLVPFVDFLLDMCAGLKYLIFSGNKPHRSYKMQTVMTTNNGYDSILIVDANDKVLSQWTATKETILDYLRDGQDAAKWDANGPDCTEISDYGTECGRDGVIDDESRAEFWGVPAQMAFQAVYKAGHPDAHCLAIGVSSTSKALLAASLTAKGISLSDVEIVPVEA